MNKPPKPNPALDRIRQIKARGTGSSFDATDAFDNPLLKQAAEQLAAERQAPVEVLPPLAQDQDAERVARRLLEIQAAGIGAPMPSNVNRYNDLRGINDKAIDMLKPVGSSIILPGERPRR